jgi:hypothetical protein
MVATSSRFVREPSVAASVLSMPALPGPRSAPTADPIIIEDSDDEEDTISIVDLTTTEDRPILNRHGRVTPRHISCPCRRSRSAQALSFRPSQSQSEPTPSQNELNSEASTTEIESYLYSLLEKYATDSDKYWFDIRPVGFSHQSQKAKWRDFHDTQTLLTYGSWLRRQGSTHHSWHGYSELFGVFLTWTHPWVPRRGFGPSSSSPDAEDWKVGSWHCWGAARVKHPSPKTSGVLLVIWDSKGWPLGREFETRGLMTMQLELVKTCERYGRVREVWFGGGGQEGAAGNVPLTADWAEGVMSAGGMGEYGVWEERGYVRLRMNHGEVVEER